MSLSEVALVALAGFYCSWLLVQDHLAGPWDILSLLRGWLERRTQAIHCAHCLGAWIMLALLLLWLLGWSLPVLFLAVLGLHTLLHTVYDRLVTY